MLFMNNIWSRITYRLNYAVHGEKLFLPEKALQKSMYFVYSFLNYAVQYMYFSS